MFAVFFLNRQNGDEFADLKSVYQQERPFEPRIAGFEYAPLAVTRGAAEEREKNKLRRIENTLLEAVEKNPSAENHHALGVFYLTQRKFEDAIKELEQAVKADEKNAQLNNDLGVAFLEFADGGDPNRKLENLARANEAFSRSLEINHEFPEARFNKSLTLQKLNLPVQAKESWEKYLEKDAASKWADEARKNLEKIAVMQSVFKPKESFSRDKEKILEDFLTAYRNKDDPFALKIHNETKGYLKDVSIPFLLSRRILEARRNRNDGGIKRKPRSNGFYRQF